MSNRIKSQQARAAADKADHTSPLRDVVAWGLGIDPRLPNTMQLRLSCGHIVDPPRGMFSDDIYVPGSRRRCVYCARLAPARDDTSGPLPGGNG